MFSSVSTISHKFKIAGIIIFLVPILMVNMLSSQQRTPNNLGHYNSMFSNNFSIKHSGYIRSYLSMCAFISRAAFRRTVLSGVFPIWPDDKIFVTMNALDR